MHSNARRITWLRGRQLPRQRRLSEAQWGAHNHGRCWKYCNGPKAEPAGAVHSQPGPFCCGEPSPCHPFVSHAYQSTQVEPDTLYPAEQETSRRGNASADPFSRSTPRTVPWAAGRATPLTPTVSTNRSAATPHQRCKWPMRTQHRSTPLRPPRGVSARKLQRRKTLSYCTVPAQHGGC